MKALGTHKFVSCSPQFSVSVSASMADRDLSGATTGSGPSEALCCISHTRKCSLPSMSSVTEQSLQHQDLEFQGDFASSWSVEAGVDDCLRFS